MARDSEDRPKLSPRVVLLSIAGFWAFYFTLVTLRSIQIEGLAPQPPLVVQRVVVCAVSAATTLHRSAMVRIDRIMRVSRDDAGNWSSKVLRAVESNVASGGRGGRRTPMSQTAKT